ncbi:Hypothetical predicted protein, partial [Pelobates cultripes]
GYYGSDHLLKKAGDLKEGEGPRPDARKIDSGEASNPDAIGTAYMARGRWCLSDAAVTTCLIKTDDLNETDSPRGEQ